MEEAQDSLARSLFRSAWSGFKRIYYDPKSPIEEADAAWRLAWVAYLRGEYKTALKYSEKAITCVENIEGVYLEKIIADGSSSWLSREKKAAVTILYEALHVGYKAYVSFALFNPEEAQLIASTNQQKPQMCSKLAMSLDDSGPRLGYTKLWQATLWAGDQSHRRINEAYDLLLGSRRDFRTDSLGEAHWTRVMGLFHCFAEHRREAEKFLHEAAERFADFPDARSLGSTLNLLSRAASKTEVRTAVTYGLAAAAVHPYGLVVKDLFGLTDGRGIEEKRLERFRRELWKSREEPFRLVSRVAQGTVRGKKVKAEDWIDNNLALLRSLESDGHSGHASVSTPPNLGHPRFVT